MIYQFEDKAPRLAEGVFVAPNATVIGNVVADENVSIWFGTIIRGDTGIIKIGRGSNIQESCVVHVNDQADTIIGEDVTLGHGVIVEGCTIGDRCLIGMGAIVLSGATIGAGSVVAAGAVVREGQSIPEGMLVAGVPAKAIRPLSEKDLERVPQVAHHYAHHRLRYMEGLRPITS